MIKINVEYINSTAPNESAVKNGLGLVKKGSLVKLCKDKEETLIFGECAGSGASNYLCSVDFIKPESPLFRCSCPSRQIPCKHAIGLMFAYCGGKEFIEAAVPEDIQQKREKAEKREEKKKEPAAENKSAKKVNKTALAKKIKTQLDNLDLLEKLVKDIVRRGFAAVDPKALDTLEQQGKTLASGYLPGAQRAIREFIQIFTMHENKGKNYSEAMNSITFIYSLCKRGREHLNKRLENPEMALDAESTIDEILGHAWQTSELEAAGLCENNIELAQLFFNLYEDEARKEYIDLGYWIDLSKGCIYKTCNYRPYRATKHIKEEDSLFSAVKLNKLYVYPGDINRRVRWEEFSLRELTSNDFDRIKSSAKGNYAEIIKSVKNTIKNPLADKNPVVLLSYSKLGMVGDNYVVEDEFGKRIMLKDAEPHREYPSTTKLPMLKKEALRNGAMLVRFNHNLESGELTAQPLTVVMDSGIIRLIF